MYGSLDNGGRHMSLFIGGNGSKESIWPTQLRLTPAKQWTAVVGAWEQGGGHQTWTAPPDFPKKWTVRKPPVRITKTSFLSRVQALHSLSSSLRRSGFKRARRMNWKAAPSFPPPASKQHQRLAAGGRGTARAGRTARGSAEGRRAPVMSAAFRAGRGTVLGAGTRSLWGTPGARGFASPNPNVKTKGRRGKMGPPPAAWRGVSRQCDASRGAVRRGTEASSASRYGA